MKTVTPDHLLDPIVSTRALARLKDRYVAEIRHHKAHELLGVVNAMKRLMNDGVTFDQLERAVTLYKNDPWRLEDPQRRSKHIRSFFTKDVILAWQQPYKKKTNVEAVEEIAARTPRPEHAARNDDEEWEL